MLFIKCAGTKSPGKMHGDERSNLGGAGVYVEGCDYNALLLFITITIIYFFTYIQV